jgi:hypothetical protein
MMRSERGPSLELFVASLMRDTTDLNLRLSGAGISRDELDYVREWARANSLLTGRYIQVTSFEKYFGKPLQRDGERMVYPLDLWPEHVFDVGLTASGGSFFEGFRLKSTDPEEHMKLDINKAPSWLAVGRHTWREVKSQLGLPAETQSWGPMEDWFYGPRNDGSYLTIGFDFGLLSTVSWGPYIAI